MLKLLCTAAVALLLGGCASFHQLNSEVSTYGTWPAGREPSTFTFERLPSQQAHPQDQQMLEDAARGALEAAGFRPAADAMSAEYLIQVGARVSSYDPWIYNEPLFWRGPPGFRHSLWGWGRGGWYGPGYGFGGYFDNTIRYEREVALLIRDRRSSELLYEARASNFGASGAIVSLLPAMFAAAMRDFPAGGPNPRSVTVQLTQR